MTRSLAGAHSPQMLASAVAELSRVYTRERGQLAELGKGDLLARAGFFFARDLVKPFGPLDELNGTGTLPRASKLRVLDLGAGLGATSFGLSRWLRLRRVPVDQLAVVALERNEPALRGFGAFTRALAGCDEFVPLTLEARREDVASLRGAGSFDLALLGFVLNELHVELPLEQRIGRRAELVLQAADLLGPEGALIILEPALKETTRELMMLRDLLAAREGAPFLIAPCLHDQGCPMLPSPRDWCHQELPYALPKGLAEVARAAGLRYEGLRYASLVLAKRPRRERAGLYRVVSDRLESKGKLELYGCGDGQYTRFTQLDRKRSEQNAAFRDAQRGHVLSIDPVTPRIEADTDVRRR